MKRTTPTPSTSMRNAALGVLCIATASSATTPSSPSSVSPPAAAASSIITSASNDALHRPWPSSTFLRKHHHRHHNTSSIIVELRGGGSEEHKKKRKGTKSSKSKKSSSSINIKHDTEEEEEEEEEETTATTGENSKSAIDTGLKEADAATALGDAIRQRASVLRADRLPTYTERTFDAALVSLGLSLGTAGTDTNGEETTRTRGRSTTEGGGEEDDDGTSIGGMVDTVAYYQYGHRNHYSRLRQNQQHVPPSTSAVIANYFLQTHGGTHVVQCLLSLLASVLGLACLALPSFPSSAGVAASVAAAGTSDSAKTLTANVLSRKILLGTVKYQLMQQTLLLGMAKHFAALLGAATLGASRIPELGIRNARRHLEMVARDPVGQYLFYCSLLVVWIGWFGGGGGGAGGMRGYVGTLRQNVISIMNAAAATAATTATEDGATSQGDASTVSQLLDALSTHSPPWFLSQSTGGSILPILILGPILLREIISTLWVGSDVLTLVVTSSNSKLCSAMLTACRSVLDAFMSVLITSERWRKADSFTRQRTLAKLVSKLSLAMELAVGAILMGDAAAAVASTFFGMGGAPGQRLPFKVILGKAACAHLYLNFLLSRRKKIVDIVGSIRGGGAVVNRVLDVLIDPRKEMGLSGDDDDAEW